MRTEIREQQAEPGGQKDCAAAATSRSRNGKPGGIPYAAATSGSRFAALRHGFTLLELLVVIAVIGIFLAVIGLSLTRTDRTAGLNSSQRTLSAVFSGARSQAAMKQQDVYVLIAADENDPDTYLRQVQVGRAVGYVTQAGPGGIQVRATDTWGNDIPILRLTGNPNTLARGVFIVPPYRDSDGNVMAGRYSSNPTRMFEEYDRILQDQGMTNPNQRDLRKSNPIYGEVEIQVAQGANLRERYLYYKMDRRGFAGTGHRVVLATGERAQAGIRFLDPDPAIGFIVRPYGSVAMIFDPRGFDESN